MTFVNKHRVTAGPGIEILYIDANNLYGQALSMKLPQKNFTWVDDTREQNDILESLPKISALEDEIGYVFEVDLIIPSSIHDLVDDLPLAPENIVIQDPTPFMNSLWELAEGKKKKYKAGKKLILSHLDKEHYVVHFALLQFYLEMGVKVTKIHRIVKFYQSAFFEPYITFNSQKRQTAASDFEKDFFKLKNNGNLYSLSIFIV